MHSERVPYSGKFRAQKSKLDFQVEKQHYTQPCTAYRLSHEARIIFVPVSLIRRVGKGQGAQATPRGLGHLRAKGTLWGRSEPIWLHNEPIKNWVKKSTKPWLDFGKICGEKRTKFANALYSITNKMCSGEVPHRRSSEGAPTTGL